VHRGKSRGLSAPDEVAKDALHGVNREQKAHGGSGIKGKGHD